MSYDFRTAQGGHNLTLSNRIVRVIVNALTCVVPEFVQQDGECFRRNGSPPEGKWCSAKFDSNDRRWVRENEVKTIINIIQNYSKAIDEHLEKNDEEDYKKFFLEFKNFCQMTIPLNGERIDDYKYGFFVC